MQCFPRYRFGGAHSSAKVSIWRMTSSIAFPTCLKLVRTFGAVADAGEGVAEVVG